MQGAEKTRGRSFTSKEKNKCIYKVKCVLPLLAGRWAPSWICFGQKCFRKTKIIKEKSPISSQLVVS